MGFISHSYTTDMWWMEKCVSVDELFEPFQYKGSVSLHSFAGNDWQWSAIAKGSLHT